MTVERKKPEAEEISLWCLPVFHLASFQVSAQTVPSSRKPSRKPCPLHSLISALISPGFHCPGIRVPHRTESRSLLESQRWLREVVQGTK